MNRLDAHLDTLDLADLHDIVLEALHTAAACDNQAKRDVAYHAGSAALAELHKRAADFCDDYIAANARAPF